MSTNKRNHIYIYSLITTEYQVGYKFTTDFEERESINRIVIQQLTRRAYNNNIT